jgi:hypothetical protein
VDDRAVREALARQVMVGDHDLDAGGAGGRNLLDRADPAVGRDHKLGAAAAQFLDARHRQPVSVGEPVGDQPVAFRTERAERGDEDRRRADAVDVVVAVDRDPARTVDQGEDPLADLLDSVELAGIV